MNKRISTTSPLAGTWKEPIQVGDPKIRGSFHGKPAYVHDILLKGKEQVKEYMIYTFSFKN